MRLFEVLERSYPVVTVNKNLNPKIWNDGELDPSVVDKLKDIAVAFKEFVGVDLDIVDVTITGSNANYTWTDYSDLDLHLIVPGVPTDEQRELYSAKKALWAEQHDITIKGLPVECYIQGEDEEHHSTGVYSLVTSGWLVEPKKIKPSVDDRAIEAKKDAVLHDIELALLSKDLEKLRTVKDKIVKMRKAGLERAGEWSTENLVFKILRNLGLIDEVSNKIRELEDQELSLENQDNLLD
jgi:hypothetical protein